MSTVNLLPSPDKILSENEVHDVRVRCNEQNHAYSVKVGAGLLAQSGGEIRQILPRQARRIFVVSNRKVFHLYGERLVESLRAENFKVAIWLIGDGERFKSFRTLERTLRALAESGLERTDAIVALGGGVVGDLAGFAASLYLRGIAFINVPTTLLAQVDASVGGKTAINLPTGKNLVGTFYQPRLVLIDTETLSTLPAREITAGWCEAVKQGAVGDRKLFDETCLFLSEQPTNKSLEISARLNRLIAAQVAFKASIVEGDEREDIGDASRRSRRVLNFGHTIAHALEAVTAFRRFRHGEAVGYGMLAAGEISASLGLLDASELKLLRRGVSLAGTLPPAKDLEQAAVLKALAGDKKSVDGSIQWILLERLGKARIVGGQKIPVPTLCAAIQAAL